MDSNIKNLISDHLSVVDTMLKDDALLSKIDTLITLIVDGYRQGKKVFFCGNGGSAADAEHIAAELSGRFKMDRAALFAEALHVNGAALTAIANDYGYQKVFSRMLEAKAGSGDILIALSTSGTSDNVLQAMDFARSISCSTIGISGCNNMSLSQNADLFIQIPSEETARIQECYMLILHIVCESVEKKLFGDV